MELGKEICLVVKTYWGVDSSTAVTKDLYKCVQNNFGRPLYWGRYLTTDPGASQGLTRDEIQLLGNSGTKILPIYNNFTSSTGYRAGLTTAIDAISSARRLGIPKGVPIFAKVERFFEVDSAWIRGWYEGMLPRGYLAGYYNDPTEGNFNKAYCAAVKENEKVAVDTILWSAEPETGPTKARNIPAFKPKSPVCKANVGIWQYGRDAAACPINTNLANRLLYEKL